jgi:hypothetical protein
MNTETAIHKLAVKISLSHVKEIENHSKYYSLEIKKICGIPVSVGLVRMANTKEQYLVMLDIEAKHAHTLTPNDRLHLTLFKSIFIKCESISLIDFYKEIISKTKKMIQNLQFNKFIGKFEIPTEECKETKMDLINEIFSDCENIEFQWDKCCACFNNTITKTPCNHTLCVECWSGLKEEHDEDDYEMEFQKCPICREEMNF